VIDIHAINPLYSVSGLLVGVLVGFTGVGGGALMTPILILLFGVHATTAVGTDLLYASITKSFGTLVHGHNDAVDWRIVRRLASGSIPATILTLALIFHLGVESHNTGGIISTVLGIALILTAITLVFRKWLLEHSATYLERLSDHQIHILTVVLGALLGTLVSLSSVGAGAIGVTALLMLYPKLQTVRIVGSDIAHAVPLTLIAGAGHWLLGSVDWSLLVSLLIGSVPGIGLGSQLASRVPDRVLRPVLAGTLVVVGAKLAV